MAVTAELYISKPEKYNSSPPPAILATPFILLYISYFVHRQYSIKHS